MLIIKTSKDLQEGQIEEDHALENDSLLKNWT